MTGFTVQQFPDEPILLVTLHEDWDVGRDVDAALDAVWQAFESTPSPVFYVVDITADLPIRLSDLMLITQKLLRGRRALLRHPNLRELLVVTHDPVFHRATKSLPWGLGRSFEALDEALTYVRRMP